MITRTSSAIFAARSARDVTKNMVRVNSSNVWGYNFEVSNEDPNYCTIYMQFKNSNGGPGDIYAYYDVPIVVYRRMHTAPSVGHYFWVYIRNKYVTAKLTGDKKLKQKPKLA